MNRFHSIAYLACMNLQYACIDDVSVRQPKVTKHSQNMCDGIFYLFMVHNLFRVYPPPLSLSLNGIFFYSAIRQYSMVT